MAQRLPSSIPAYATHHHHHSHDYSSPPSHTYRHHDSMNQRSSQSQQVWSSYGHFNPNAQHPPSPTARYSPHYSSQASYDHSHPSYDPQQSSGQPLRTRTISQSPPYHGVPRPPLEHSYSQQDYVVLSHRSSSQQDRWEQAASMQRPHTTLGSKPPLTRIDTAPAAPEGYFSSHSPYSSYGNSPIARVASVDDARTSSPSIQTSPVNSARPHVCDICSTAFARGHDLKRHKETHNNTKPHTCECGKSFTRKDALKRHVFLKSCGKDASRDD